MMKDAPSRRARQSEPGQGSRSIPRSHTPSRGDRVPRSSESRAVSARPLVDPNKPTIQDIKARAARLSAPAIEEVSPASPERKKPLGMKGVLTKKKVVDTLAEVTGLDCFPDVTSGPQASPELKELARPKETPEKALCNPWGHAKNAVTPTMALKFASSTPRNSAHSQTKPSQLSKKFMNIKSALMLREEYSDIVRDMNQSNAAGCIKLERFILKTSDLLSLKKLFDFMDVDGDNLLTMNDVCLQRRELKLEKDKTKKDQNTRSHGGDESSDSMIMMMLATDDSISFEELLMVTYPQMSPADVEVCVDHLVTLHKPVKEREVVMPKKRFSRSFWHELEDAEKNFQIYADANGAMSERQFNALVTAMLGQERSKPRYSDIANRRTKAIHRKEFVMWWIELFRETPVMWEDIQEDVEKYWADRDKEIEEENLYMNTMK